MILGAKINKLFVEDQTLTDSILLRQKGHLVKIDISYTLLKVKLYGIISVVTIILCSKVSFDVDA